MFARKTEGMVTAGNRQLLNCFHGRGMVKVTRIDKEVKLKQDPCNGFLLSAVEMQDDLRCGNDGVAMFCLKTEAFRRYCINANIALVRPEFLEHLRQEGRVWPRRQEAEQIPGADWPNRFRLAHMSLVKLMHPSF